MKNHANFKFKQSESEIKKCIANYLQILENQSKLYADYILIIIYILVIK